MTSRTHNTKTVLVALKAQKKDFTVLRVEKAVDVS